MIVFINCFQIEKRRWNFLFFHIDEKTSIHEVIALLIYTCTGNIDAGWRSCWFIFSFYMVKELNDIAKLKMKVLKMMLMSIDIKKNVFLSKRKSVHIFDRRCEQISKIMREIFQIMHYENFIRVDERKNRSSKKANSGDFTPIKFIVDRRRDIQDRKFFFLFISSSILSRWNLCSKMWVKIYCSDLVTSNTLKYIKTNFENGESL